MKIFKLFTLFLITSVLLLPAGTSNFLNAFSVDSTLTAPVLISPAAGSILGFDDMLLVWHSTPNTVSYRVKIASDSARFIYVRVDTAGIKDTTLSLQKFLGTQLNIGTKYYWNVNALDSAGNESLYSSKWSFTAKYGFNRNTLDTITSTFNWFSNNPPNSSGSNFNDRWKKSLLLDSLGYLISNTAWNSYRSYWSSYSSLADGMENQYPILYYMRQADLHAYDEIRNTVVKKGVSIWLLYNVGYIVKTKDKCFGVDINARGSTDLADVLDFAIVTHIHSDHYEPNFVKAMTSLGKTVYAPFSANGTTVVSSTIEYNIGDVNVRFTMSHQESDIVVIVPQIDCGPSTGHYTIYDLADARPAITDINPTKHINLFIIDIQNGIDVFAAVDRVKPDASIYAHEMELGHPIGQGWRWKYGYTYNKISPRLHSSSYVLTWGEKIVADSLTTGIGKSNEFLPGSFQLNQNYPNPFNPSTTIKYSILKSGLVTLKVFNIIGQEVAALVNKVQDPGNYELNYNAAGLPSGIYLYRLQCNQDSQTKKLLLLK